MTGLSTFLFEAKHFVRSPFKVVAVVLFILAGVYGLHHGARLYHTQQEELAAIQETVSENRQQYLDYYDAGKTGPENRPWVNIEEPFWAVWLSNVYHFKAPSPALVYSIGQAEQYGFYKRVSFQSSPYDADMTQEIANPERLQTGTLDFTFVLLFLLPLLLLILLYNLKSMETEQGFMALIEVQTASRRRWLLSRLLFYVGLVFVVIFGLLIYGATLTEVFASTPEAFVQMLLYSLFYLLLWALVYLIIVSRGASVMGNTLKMVGVWLMVAFIIPGGVQQWISMEKPANLMTDYIDATRDETQQLYDLPDSVYQAKLQALFPEILDSPVMQDSVGRAYAYGDSYAALVNELMKSTIAPIEAENEQKNQWVRASYLFNPVAFFQNRLHTISQTHYDDYQVYRGAIQASIDLQNRAMVLDTWGGVVVDKAKYQEYYQSFTSP
ncbi:MAG: hypothetical protein AAFQ98_06145 [Bacteroidota bacterium]